MRSIGHVALLATGALMGCGAEGVTPEDDPPDEPEPIVCDAGFSPVDEACVPVGMTADACPEGWVFTDDVCMPVLPGDCPPGTMALAGEPACRPVSPCVDGTWGDIAVDAATQHVDASYGGVGSDGSAATPWTSIASAIAAAAPGAVIAIARGTYDEALSIGKPVTLWGVCPAETTITSSGAQTILFGPGSAGAVLRNVGVSGQAIGVLASGTDVTLDRVWSHDSGAIAVVAEGALGPALVTMKDSLVEAYARIGVQALGADVVIERSVVGRPTPFDRGAGIWAQGTVAGTRANVTVTDTIVDRPTFIGLLASAADVVVERSAVLSPAPSSTDGRGWGILSQAQPETGDQALVTMSQSAVAHAAELGISLAGGRGAFSNVSVFGGTGGAARGMEAEDSNGVRAELAMNDSTVAMSQQVGLLCGGSDVTLTRVQVRGVQPSLTGSLGRAMVFQTNPSTFLPSSAVVSESLIRDNLDIGVLVANSTLEMTDTGIYDTAPRIDDATFGDGISVVTTEPSVPAAATLARMQVRGNARAGVAAFGAAVTLTDSALSCNGFDLNAEPVGGVAPTITDAGGNACGCEQAQTCKVLSSALAPPETL